jgi:hypothetical protein
MQNLISRSLSHLTSRFNRRKLILCGSAGAVGTLFSIPLSAYAADRPAWAATSFDQGGETLQTCQGIAKYQLEMHQFTIATSGSYFIVGSNASTFVSIAFAPIDESTTNIIVIASSTDITVARQVRDSITAAIKDTRQ